MIFMIKIEHNKRLEGFMKPYIWKSCFFLALCLLMIASVLFSLLYRKLKQQKEHLKFLSSILDANRNEIKASLLLKLCYHDKSKPEPLSPMLPFFEPDGELEHTAVSLVHFPASSQLSNSFHKDTFRMLQSRLLILCQDTAEEFFPSFWIWETPDTLLGILNIAENFSESLCLPILNQLGERLQKACFMEEEHPPIIAFGSMVSSEELLHRSYDEAAELLNHKLHNHISTPYSYEEFQRTEIQFDYHKQQLLARYVRLGKAKEASAFLSSYFSVIHANPYTSVAYVRDITEQILELISSVVREMPVILSDCAPKLEYAKEQTEHLTHVHDFGQFLLPLVQNVCNSIAAVSANKGKLKIDGLISWIQENYHQDLSLEDMAAKIGCSPTYTSKLFKKETNYDIITYLSSIRIAHAKELLCTTKMTLEEISAAVGFNHQQTFIRNFKKLTGLTPTEYRNSNTSTS